MARTATKEMLDSWHKDKAVQDNIVESWLCVDCGINTCPGTPSGPEHRIAFALDPEARLTHHFDDKTEVYDVKDSVWEAAGMRAWNGCLCILCLERRIGRELRPKDFSQHDRDVWAELPCTERLLNRRGYATATVLTADGPKRVICDVDDAPLIEGKFMEREDSETIS